MQILCLHSDYVPNSEDEKINLITPISKCYNAALDGIRRRRKLEFYFYMTLTKLKTIILISMCLRLVSGLNQCLVFFNETPLVLIRSSRGGGCVNELQPCR